MVVVVVKSLFVLMVTNYSTLGKVSRCRVWSVDALGLSLILLPFFLYCVFEETRWIEAFFLSRKSFGNEVLNLSVMDFPASGVLNGTARLPF